MQIRLFYIQRGGAINIVNRRSVQSIETSVDNSAMKTYILDKLRAWAIVFVIVSGCNSGFTLHSVKTSPWYAGWDSSPITSAGNSVSTNSRNQGVIKVIANGYDATGVWRVLPLVVSYKYNGVQYDVNVLNAWNPWTDQWDKGVDVPAYNTNFLLRNITYDFYAVLSFGTFYFNL